MTTMTDFETISLAELNQTAALQSRTDRKYPLHRADAEMALATMPSGARILEIDGQTSFEYFSVYFDTYAFDSYLQAARGRRFRFKVRTRHYVETDQAFLEVKTKEAGRTVKRRIPHDAQRLFEIAPEQHDFIASSLALGRVAGIAPAWLRPVLVTNYRRQTFLAPDGSTRMTLDRDLHWRSPGSGQRSVDDLAIVETKTARGVSCLDRYLWSLGHRPGRISKYATGLASLREELPSNRWNRTLLTYFD